MSSVSFRYVALVFSHFTGFEFEKYEITLDGRSLGEQDSAKDEYSAVIEADPCLKHDVSIKIKVTYGWYWVWRKTKTAYYNDVDEPDSLFSNLLKESLKRLCKVNATIQLKLLPEDVGKKCIKNIEKGQGTVLLEKRARHYA